MITAPDILVAYVKCSPSIIPQTMSKFTSGLTPLLAVSITILIWAAAFPAISLALEEIDPLPLAAARFSIAAFLAMVWLSFARPAMMPPADLARCVASGIVAGVGYSVLLNLGQQTVPAGAAAFLIKTESVWMAAFAVVLLKERFTGFAWGGTLLCVIGVSAIALAQPGGLKMGAGAPLILAAALSSSVGFTLQRGLAVRHGALHVAAITFIVAALVLSWCLPQAASQLQIASPATIAWVGFLGVFPTAIGLTCWAYALGQYGVARCGNFLYLVAPLAMAIDWLIAGEEPTITTVFGGALILAGVVIVNSLGRQGVTPNVAARTPDTMKRLPALVQAALYGITLRNKV